VKIYDHLIQQGARPEKARAFLEYHLANPSVWKAFESFALELASKGRDNYSAMQVLGLARYHSEAQGNDGFKINNNMAPYFSRCFALKHPQYANFFEQRTLNAKTRTN
jgi:hypothetical protein